MQANPTLWAEHRDLRHLRRRRRLLGLGYVQPLDFFGDGTRIPMIVVSPYSMGGHISHTYTDHVSTLKFIEANWGLQPITNRSRDNLPNPPHGSANPVRPHQFAGDRRHDGYVQFPALGITAEHGHGGRFKLNLRHDRDPGPLDGAALFHWPIRRAAALFRPRYASPTTGLIAAAGLRGVRLTRRVGHCFGAAVIAEEQRAAGDCERRGSTRGECVT